MPTEVTCTTIWIWICSAGQIIEKTVADCLEYVDTVRSAVQTHCKAEVGLRIICWHGELCDVRSNSLNCGSANRCVKSA